MNRSSSANEAIVNCFIAVAAVAANSPQRLQLHFIVMSFRHRTLHITSHPIPFHPIPSPFASSYFMTQTGVAKFTSPRECSGLANKPTNQFARCLGAQNPSFPPNPILNLQYTIPSQLYGYGCGSIWPLRLALFHSWLRFMSQGRVSWKEEAKNVPKQIVFALPAPKVAPWACA